MKCFFLSNEAPASLAPLCVGTRLADFPIANIPFGQLVRRHLDSVGFADGCEHSEGLSLYVRGDVWLSEDVYEMLSNADAPLVFRDTAGCPLCWLGWEERAPVDAEAVVSEASFRVRHPWDLLRINETYVSRISSDCIAGEVDKDVHVDGYVSMGEGSRLLPGTYIEGDVVIGANCRIGPNCYIRGNTSIGNDCRIGNAVEIKNSLIMDGTAIGHLSYCGDSIVGREVNFGAGTITANFRHDGRNHRSMVGRELQDTGRRKFGAVIGDRVHTGIHTSIYPGRKLWPDTSTRPGDIVDRDLKNAED